jgi:hypothetical protein
MVPAKLGRSARITGQGRMVDKRVPSWRHVPEGSHTLIIDSAWGPLVTRTGPAGGTEVDLSTAAETGKASWSVPLSFAGGYCLSFSSVRKGEPIQWELTGNHGEFESRVETIPLEEFSGTGHSWTTCEVVEFPNQIKAFPIGDLEARIAERSGITLMDTKLSGRRAEQPFQVELSVRLVSEGSACIAARDALALITLKREDILLPYAGDGRYELRASTTRPRGAE